MGLRINTNMAALIGQRNVGRTDRALNKSLERLSSGLRINRAADSPAGLAIAERYRAQVAGLNQAVENVERATSLVQTAEAAVDEVNTILVHMRELAIDSANTAVNDAPALAANQAEIDDALAALDRIARDTAFGSKKLLDGSAANSTTFSDGANDTIYASISNGTLSTGSYSLELTSVTDAGWAAENTTTRDAMGITGALSLDAQDVNGLTAGPHVVKVTQASTAATLEGTVTLADLTGGAASEGFRIVVYDSAGNVTAATDIELEGDYTAGGGAGTDADFQDLIDDINDNSGKGTTTNDIETDANIGLGGGAVAKVEAYAVGALADRTIGFRTTVEGSDAYVQVIASDGTADGEALGGILSGFAANDSSASAVTATGTQGVDAIVELDGNATTVTYVEGDDSETATVVTLTDTDDGTLKFQVDNSTQIASYAERGLLVGNLVVNITAAAGTAILYDDVGGVAGTGTAGSSVSFTADTAFSISEYGTGGGSLSVTIGDQMMLDGAGAGTAYEDLTVVDNALVFQVGGDRNQTATLSLLDVGSDTLAQNITNTSNFASLDVVNVTTAQGAQDTILLVDQAISEVLDVRANIGSFQSNVLESQFRNLTVASENLTGARSTIMDADFAYEVSEFTKQQILLQSGMSILASAGQMPQLVLSLLR